MANHKSAEKRIRQTERRTIVNRGGRSQLRTEIKKLRAAIDSGDQAEASKLLQGTISLIDKSVQKGILHRNAAARHKSRLTGHVSQLSAAK